MSDKIAVGDCVVFTDPVAQDHQALVTAVWGSKDSPNEPAINIVFVSDDENRTDQYGRQVLHNTSVVHRSMQAAHGMFWRRANE